ncbi:DUF3784 domain-containing protein [uncultured Anaerococcus sp.]|uniref:DUF3784 domain-containing protein n=1 Tax=uncultured Anaerococcus sp. TaxID=293428 RepID=UPI00262B17A6|nr:DUF3784 domain-containing protein [uncultured Anaerococcus sp.]
MHLADPGDIKLKVFLLVPVILCLIILFLVDKTNGNIIAGFNLMEEEKKEDLIKRGYLKKVKVMILIMCLPLVFAFLSSFFVSDMELFDIIMMKAWGIFAIITILGIILVNYSMRN